MPQLDRIIVFPQIFWLIIGFITAYIMLSYYFFPKFLQSIKSRKEIINLNLKELLKLQQVHEKKSIILRESTVKNLILIKHFLNENYLFSIFKKCDMDTQIIDLYFSSVVCNLVLYYDINLLNKVPLKLKSSLLFSDKNSKS